MTDQNNRQDQRSGSQPGMNPSGGTNPGRQDTGQQEQEDRRRKDGDESRDWENPGQQQADQSNQGRQQDSDYEEAERSGQHAGDGDKRGGQM